MAAVTFSGFNNIDFNQVVSAIMEQERQPLTTLQTRHSTLDTQKTAFGTLAGRLTLYSPRSIRSPRRQVSPR